VVPNTAVDGSQGPQVASNQSSRDERPRMRDSGWDVDMEDGTSAASYCRNENAEPPRVKNAKGKTKMTDAQYDESKAEEAAIAQSQQAEAAIAQFQQAEAQLQKEEQQLRDAAGPRFPEAAFRMFGVCEFLGSEVLFLDAFASALRMWKTVYTPSSDQAQDHSNEAGPSSRPIQRQVQPWSPLRDRAAQRLILKLLEDGCTEERMDYLLGPVIGRVRRLNALLVDEQHRRSNEQAQSDEQGASDHSIDAQLALAVTYGDGDTEEESSQ